MWNHSKFPYIFITLLVILALFPRQKLAPADDAFAVIHTAFYYETSKFYKNNTAVILFFADSKIKAKQLFNCESANQKTVFTTEPDIDPVSSIAKRCPWTTFIARCPVLPNMTKLSIRKSMLDLPIPIPFEQPDRKPRSIVACYAPMFYEERWQVIAMAHELYAAWGVDLQVHYVHSAIGDLVKLLSPLVEKGWLEVRGMDIPDFGEDVNSKLGYNSAVKTEFRHQVMTYQDCFFRYRESAEFIIIGDVDDIFVPTHGVSLLHEFRYWKKLNPTASGYLYDRTVAHAITSDGIKDFDYFKTIKSIRTVKNTTETAPKTVYNPKYAETPWIHWPGITKTATFKVPSGQGLCIHLHYFYGAKSNMIPRGTPLSNYVNISILQNSKINYTNAKQTLNKLSTVPFQYAEAIHKCYIGFNADKNLQKDEETGYCPTPTICNLPQKNVTSTFAIRYYKKNCLGHTNLCIIVPIAPPKLMFANNTKTD